MKTLCAGGCPLSPIWLRCHHQRHHLREVGIQLPPHLPHVPICAKLSSARTNSQTSPTGTPHHSARSARSEAVMYVDVSISRGGGSRGA